MFEKNLHASEKPKTEMRFRTVLKDSKIFKGVLKGIAAIVDEAVFVIKPEGIYLRDMDPGRVALIDFFFPKTAFDIFELEKPEVILPIKANELLKHLERVKKEEMVTLLIEGGRLGILIEGKIKKNYRIPLLTTQRSESPLPKTRATVNGKISLPSLQEHFEDIRIISDEVTIEALQDKIIFYGEERGAVRSGLIEVKKGAEELPVYNCTQTTKSLYSLPYLLDVIKGISRVSDLVALEFGSNRPIELSFDLLQGSFTFYLAPRPI